jgi:hypothetical protein
MANGGGGTLDAPTGIRLTMHIFVARKGDYYGIEGFAPSDLFPGGMAAGTLNRDPE